MAFSHVARITVEGDDTEMWLGGRVTLPPYIRIAVACALAGCAYRPNSFSDGGGGWPGQRATVGCVDLAIERRVDLPLGPVLRYRFANRCDRALAIDLSALPVVGHAADGAERALRPYDPMAELHAVALEARSVGVEALAYPSEGPVAQICVDAAALVHQTPARWLCMGAAPAAPTASQPAVARSAQ